MYLPITEGFSMEGMFEGAAIGAAAGAIARGLATPGPLVIKAAGAAAGAIGGAAVLGTVGAAVDFAGNLIKTINTIYTDDSAFNDYLAVLAGMPLRTQVYSSSKISYNVAMAVAQWKTFYTNAAFASFAGNTMPAKLAGHLFRGVTRENPKY
jgi:hypothetical protein